MEKGTKRSHILIIVLLVALLLCLFSIIGISFTDFGKRLIVNSGFVEEESSVCDIKSIEPIMEIFKAFDESTTRFIEGNKTPQDSIRLAGNIMAYRDVLIATDVDPCAQKLKNLLIEAFDEFITAHLEYGGLNFDKATYHFNKADKLLGMVLEEMKRLNNNN